jgi:hypothetical protein
MDRESFLELIDIVPQVNLIIASEHAVGGPVSDVFTLDALDITQKPHALHKILKIVRHIWDKK